MPKDKEFLKFMPLAIAFGKSEYIEIIALHTNTKLKLHRDHIPLLIDGLKDLNYEAALSSPSISCSDFPSLDCENDKIP